MYEGAEGTNMEEIREMFLGIEKKEHELQAKHRTNAEGLGFIEVAAAFPAEVEEFIEKRDEVLELEGDQKERVQRLIEKLWRGVLDDPSEVGSLDELIGLYHQYQLKKLSQGH